MAKPKLSYFDAPVSRGEECRLALHLAGIDFEDHRVKRADWPALKPHTPYGSMPFLELPGGPTLAHSNAILTYVGQRSGLHPQDPLEAALHLAMMCHVEDLRALVAPTLRIEDPAAKRSAREALARDALPTWGAAAERNIPGGPFFAGERLHVVDLKLYAVVRWFASGTVDHVPADVFAPFSKLTRVFEAVRAHPGVQAWYAKRA